MRRLQVSEQRRSSSERRIAEQCTTIRSLSPIRNLAQPAVAFWLPADPLLVPASPLSPVPSPCHCPSDIRTPSHTLSVPGTGLRRRTSRTSDRKRRRVSELLKSMTFQSVLTAAQRTFPFTVHSHPRPTSYPSSPATMSKFRVRDVAPV